MIHVSDLPPVEVAVSPLEKFQEFLATRRKRLTPERRIVVEELLAGHEHFDSEQLVERLSQRKDKQRVSRATVYRTLADLEEAGLIRKVARTDGREIYEHDYGYPEHDHLICSRCKQLIEFPAETISTLLEDIAAAHGFRMTGHRLEVHGLCDACARPPSRRNPKLDLL